MFKGNFVRNGGAVSSKDYVLHISACNFYNNTAVIDGSALSFFGTDLSGLVVLNGTNDIQWNPGTISGLVILNGTNSFQWNQAKSSGAVSMTCARVIINGENMFFNNTGTIGTGSLTLTATSSFICSNLTFLRNYMLHMGVDYMQL